MRLFGTTVLFLALSGSAASLVVETPSSSAISRRRAFVSIASTATLPFYTANADDSTSLVDYATRDRKGNKEAVIREDYWYMLGKTPPRRLDAPLKGDDPQWNAFGSCTSSETGGNSCTYVSLGQRTLAYGKYSFAIADGSKEYQKLGRILRSATSSENAWSEAVPYFAREPGSPPPPVVDAELKMVLLATALTTSPNFPGPSRELLVARFYCNEASFAHKEIMAAIEARDSDRALQAWEFGRDSWNSYFQVVNRSIVPKVGEKFEPIEV